jgi:hypothetical protein
MTDRWQSLIAELDDVEERIFAADLVVGAVSRLKDRAEALYSQARRELVRTNAHPTVRWYRRND